MDVKIESEKPVLEPLIKIRKKPGRKPNPASPALRKAQNRAAQRAFRERKESYIKELENVNKKLHEQKDKFQTENQELKVEVEIMSSENWYLKGIVLTLHLLCYQHNLVIPQHGPFFSDKVLSVLSQSIPKSITSYMDLHGISKLPKPENVFSLKNNIKQGGRVLSSSFSVAVTEDGIRPLSDTVGFKPDMGSILHVENSKSVNTMCDANPSVDVLVHPLEVKCPAPPLSPAPDNPMSDNGYNKLLRPVLLTNEPITSNLAAVQALRLRLRLQNIRARTDAQSFVIRPTLLQLTVPHDPRIDLLPTPHMRDRMILYRDRFDLDDCFRCLLEKSKFHGGDPAIAANWELPLEFFEKYWFLTIDYDLRRTTNKWRSLQGLSKLELENSKDIKPELKASNISENQQKQPNLEPSESPNLNFNDISSLLDFDFMKFTQQNNTTLNNTQTTSPSTYRQKELEPLFRPTTTEINMPTIEPVLLTDASKIPGTKPVMRTTTAAAHKPHRHHPYFNNKSNNNSSNTYNPWDNPIYKQKDCDMLIDYLINAEQSSSFIK